MDKQPKFTRYERLAEETLSRVSEDIENWKSFLDTASAMYKYSFDEQILIYAQKPDAVACAGFDFWTGKDKMNRHIKAGTSGIALINRDTGSLYYVYSSKDTTAKENGSSKDPQEYMWQMNSGNESDVAEMLRTRFRIEGDSIADNLAKLSELAVTAKFPQYAPQLEFKCDYLNIPYTQEINDAFFKVLKDSAAYVTLKRCGYDVSDFEFDVSAFNAVDSRCTTVIGQALNLMTKTALRQVERTVGLPVNNKRSNENEYNRNERTSTEKSGEWDRVHSGQENNDISSEVHRERTGDDRQIRENEREVSEGTEGRSIHGDDTQQYTDSTSSVDRRTGGQNNGSDSENVSREGEHERRTEDAESAGMGGQNEQLQTDSRRDNTERTDLRLTQAEEDFLTADIIPTMAKSVLAWDEIESLGYILYEEGYTERYSASSRAVYGNGAYEQTVYDLAERMKNGEDIRADLTRALFGNQQIFRTHDDDEFSVIYNKNDITAVFGNAERSISYEAVGDAFLNLIEGEYKEILKSREEGIIWTPVPDVEGGGSYSTKLDDTFYWISQNEEGGYDIETTLADGTIGAIFLNFESRFAAEEYFEENLDLFRKQNKEDHLSFSWGRDPEWFTESALLESFAKEHPDVSFALANAVYEYLDEKQHTEREIPELNAGWYKKSDFVLTGVFNGEELNYEGRFDIGDGKGTGGGSIIDHIRDFQTGVVNSDRYPYDNNERKAEAQEALDTFIPFLEANSKLSPEEEQILADFKNANPVRTKETARLEQWKNLDLIYNMPAFDEIDWVYFNPDSIEGGQLVVNNISYETLRQAENADNYIDYITENADQYLYDVTSESFAEIADSYLKDRENAIYDGKSGDNANITAFLKDYYADNIAVNATTEEIVTENETSSTAVVTLRDAVDKYFGTDCDFAETEDGEWRIQIYDGTSENLLNRDIIGVVYHNNVPVCDIHNVSADSFRIQSRNTDGNSIADDIAEMMRDRRPDQKFDVEKYEKRELQIGDKFRNKRRRHEVLEVVSLSGALPWYTDDCTVTRTEGNFEITGNMRIDDLLDTSKYEYISEQQEQKIEGTFSIYQMKSGEEYHYQRFEGIDSLRQQNFLPCISDYNLVYTGSLDMLDSKSNLPEEIFNKFNMDIPSDFTGHSLSVSDVVVIEQNGEKINHFVDTLGFEELPEFFTERVTAEEIMPSEEELTYIEKEFRDKFENIYAQDWSNHGKIRKANDEDTLICVKKTDWKAFLENQLKDYDYKTNPPTVKCEWSESRAFEEGKTYTLAEFDTVMADADKAFVEGKAEVIRRCGSFENTNDDADWQFAGYDKTKFIINIPGVGSFTERQDIGDGFGGVIDFLSNYSTFEPLIPMLRNAAEYERAVTRLEIPDNNIFIDLKDIDRLEIVNHFSVYEGGTDSEGHELKDNYSAHADKLTVEFADNRIYITEAKADSDFPPVINEYEANAETVNTVKGIISNFINNGEVINANTYTGNTKETVIVAQSPSFFAERYKDNADIFVLKDKKTNDTLATGTAQELIEYGHNANLNEFDLKAVVEGISTNHFDIPVVYTAEDKEAFKESVKENNRCRDLIEHAIADNYSYENHTFDYDKAYSTVSAVYPMERIQLVTAATINAHKGDGRIDESVHKWAEDKINEIPSDIFKRTQLTYLAVNNHCGLVNMFAQEVIAKEKQLEQEADKAFEEAVIEEYELDNAKQAITEYFEKENFGTGDFSDLTNIDLAYTTLEGTDIEIQVSADLENTAINTFINGYLFSVEGYDTLEDMTRDALSVMTFDDLISVDSDEVKNFLAKNGVLTQNEEKYSIYQMKTEGKYRHFQSESIDYCKSQNFYPTASDFNLVRTGSLAGIQGDDILEEIRSKHSLDISNVIVIERNGEKTAHYTERRGFQNFPDFFNGQENNIEWTPVAETADDEGHISSYSTKINDRFYRISENPNKRYDIETQYGDTISPVSEECTNFLTRDMAEQYFEENLDVIVNTYSIEFKENVAVETVKETAKIENDTPIVKGEQLSLFEEETDSKTQHLIDEIMRGTGFEDGKFRMKEYFDENKPNTKEFAQKLKQEYGIGGHSGNGDIRFADHDAKGITIELITGEKLSYSWNEVAKTLTNLINSDEYITQKDIDERIRHSEYIIKNYNPETADEYDKRQFEKANAILEEYGKNVSVNAEKPEPVNYHIETSNTVEGGPKTKYKANVEAIRTLKTIESENRLATPEEQDTLAKYIGWGGLANAFDPNKSDWANEYAELKELLTDDEYTSARASTLTAFYTDNMICEEMWKMLADNGFIGGNILEPAVATGNFFGTMPLDISSNSNLYGVELDDISGRIAKQLYQKADIQITGFENTRFKNESVDLVISNVPFDSTHVIDAEESEMKKSRQKIDGISKSKLTLNDYFIEKSLDKVKPGGIVMVITSKGTLDKKDSFIRQDIAKRADLVGAVRLPNTAFKGNAGTDVTADILILQKRDKAIEITPDWVNKGITEEGFSVNQYFVDNPDMVLGKIVQGNKMYGDNDDTSVVAIEGADLKEQLRTAFSKIKLSVNENTDEIIIDNSPVMDVPVDIPAETKPFSYVVDNNKLYFYDNSSMTEFDGPKATGERIKGMTEIRDCLRTLISSQLNDDEEGKIQYLQHTLNDLYDKFVSKHGHLNDKANLKAFKDDMSLPLLSSLEEIKNGEVVGKAGIFEKRTINPKREITSVDTASEALALSISEKAMVDISYMSSLTGMTAEKLLSDLKGVVYENPQKMDENGNPHLEMSDEYLSGNVRAKLKFLKENYADDSRYALNISSLETVMPKDLDAADIKWQLGNPVIEKDDVNAFMYDLLKTPGYNRKGSYFSSKQIKAEYVEYTATWSISNPKGDPNNIRARTTYGTTRKTAYELIEDCLNQKATVVKDAHIVDGTKYWI